MEYEDHHGLESPPYERWSVSPCCEDWYANARMCNICGEYIIGSYIKTVEDDYICENCYTNYEIGEEEND